MAVNHPMHEDAAQRSPVLVSRQPVVDLWDRVAGYRISHALLNGDRPVAPAPERTAEMIGDVLEVIGREEVERGARIHLPLAREVLLGGGVPLLAADQVLLRIRHEDTASAPMMRLLQRAAERGYELELDGLPGPEFDNSLLDLFTRVEVDFAAWTPDAVAALVPKLRGRGALALAAGVETHGQREQARSLGCEWFAGPFFATPNPPAGKSIPIGDMRTVVELTRLRGRRRPARGPRRLDRA